MVDLVPNHEDIQVFHPKLGMKVPAYLEKAAQKELQRMLDAGMLEQIHSYTPHVSRGFFVEKGSTKPGEPVKCRLVADFRGVNRKLKRPEHPLENSWGILKRLNPDHQYFAAVDFSSGFSQLPLAEESRHLFNILLPWGKYCYCVLPQGLSVSPELFDINTAEEIRNTEGIWKNADDVLGGGSRLEELDQRMRRVFTVCKRRGIKLSPSKLQCGRRIKWGGVVIESVGPLGEGQSNVNISPDEQKVAEFIDIKTPSSKKECQMIAGTAAQLKRFCPGMQIQYPGIMRLCSPNTRFQWSDDLDKELEDLKQCLKDHVKISPINTEKNLEMVIDAAPTVDCSYLLLQKKDEDPSHGYIFFIHGQHQLP